MLWLHEWEERLSGWWATTPIGRHGGLGGCAGALGLHLAERLERQLQALREMRHFERVGPTFGGTMVSLPPPPPLGSRTATSESCQWVGQYADRDLRFPQFPKFPGKFKSETLRPPWWLPPLKRPKWLNEHFGRREGGAFEGGAFAGEAPRGRDAPTSSQTSSTLRAVLAGAMGIAAGAVAGFAGMCAGAQALRRHRARRGRAALQSTQQQRSSHRRRRKECAGDCGDTGSAAVAHSLPGACSLRDSLRTL